MIGNSSDCPQHEVPLNDPLPMKPDWIHLPSDLEPRSLWDSLHDGKLQSCRSDLLNRSLRLQFHIWHLVEEGSDTTFDFYLSEVTSARATITVRWPGECVLPPAASREVQGILIAEYQAKWREQSLGWSEFETAFPANLLVISNASLAVGAESGTLQLQGMLDGDTFDDLYCEVCIDFNGLVIKTSENQELSLDEFDQLGIAYWEAWQNHKSVS